MLIYRFQEQGHGQVIAESVTPGLGTYQGVFFPASDIPEHARELYRLNWLRIIPDAAYVPAPMVPALRPDNGQVLSMQISALENLQAQRQRQAKDGLLKLPRQCHDRRRE